MGLFDYFKTVWEDSPSHTTPISADNLNKLENGVKQANDGLAAFQTSTTPRVGMFSALASTAPVIPSAVGVVGTDGHHTAALGSAVYVYDAAVNGTYVTANPKTSFLAADGRGFRMHTQQRVNPFMFGAVGDGTTDDGTALAAFFTFITASDVGTADANGTFSSSTALTLGASGTPATKNISGTFNLTMSGSGQYALTVKNFNGTFDTVNLTGTGSAAAGSYASRTWETGLLLDGSGRCTFKRVTATLFAYAGVAPVLNNNTLANLGSVRVTDSGSGVPTFGLTTTWSTPVNAGVSGSGGQTTTLTVGTLPPSYIGSSTYGAVGDAPYFLRITDGATTRLHFITAVNTGASTVTVFPWVSSTAVPGTADYVYGGGVSLRGADGNVIGFDAIDVTRCGIGVAASSLYGPIARRVVTQACGTAILIGRSISGASYGGQLSGCYFESNVEDAVWLNSSTTTYSAIDSDYGMTLSKSFLLSVPRNTDNTFATSFMGLRFGRFVQQGRRHNYEKVPYGVITSANPLTINRSDMVYPLSSNTCTIAPTGLDTNLHRLTGYDTARVIVTGTGTGGAPTGTVTFNVPTANPETWTLNGGSSSVAFSSFSAGPAEFIVAFNATTLDCKVTQIVRSLTTLVESRVVGIDLSVTGKRFRTGRILPVTTTVSTGLVRFAPLIVYGAGIITGIELRTSTAGIAGTSRLGIYAADATTLAPTGAALQDFGLWDLTVTAGVLTGPLVNYTVPAPGVYWLALTTSGYTTNPVIYCDGTMYGFVPATSNLISGGSGYSQTVASNALPTVGTLLADQAASISYNLKT